MNCGDSCILIVEDSPTQAATLEYILKDLGHEILIAGNGREALECLKNHKPSVIISDIVMPEMNGFQFCEAIKKREELKDIPVILLTSLSHPLDVIKGLQSGADNFLTKPYDENHIISRIQSFLNRSKKETRENDVHVYFADNKYKINSSRQQILDFFFTAYEVTIQKNTELTKVQKELRELNESLEDEVKKRSKSLITEINERMQVQQELHEKEIHLTRLTENMLDMIAQCDAAGTFLYVSPSSKNVLGFEPEALVGGKFYDLMHPEERRKFIADQQFNSSVFLSDRTECRFKHAKGHFVWLETVANPSFSKNNQIREIVFGIRDITDRKKAEEETKQSFVKLKKTLDEVIQAMGATVETRDVYTAGHQKRVAQLSEAIARELGFSRKEIEGVRLAASIHDIGKIYIPAEFLSKPGIISDTEFKMIKLHPQVGSEILSMIDFPWPIAKIVAQHHERVDGSGYPASIRHENILIEARIIGVADTVDAMASHRPYRASLGIDKALEEIAKNSGVLYDERVAAVCLRLFEEKEFMFNSTSPEEKISW